MKDLFLIVGAQRSGTSYLYQLLDKHPNIYMARPMCPEPKFFCNKKEYAKGKKYYLNKYFNNTNNCYKTVGEKSTSYMTTAGTPKRIYTMFPKAKLIFMLRNPIQRAISNYWFSVKNGIETASFANAVKNEKSRMKNNPMPDYSVHPWGYLTRGEYYKYIEKYLKYFPRYNLLFLKSEKLFNGNYSSYEKICNFLKVEAKLPSTIFGKKVNDVERNNKVLTAELKQFMINYFKESNNKLENLTGISWSDL